MYCPSSAECDRCGKKLGDERYEDSDEDKVYCQECFDLMKVEIEELRETVEKLQGENAVLDESVGAAALIIEKLQKGGVQVGETV